MNRGDTLGRYLVIGRVGAGGMAVVYSAYDPTLDRKVALKLVRPDLDGGSGTPASRTRLLREAQAMARLSHPNVVSVYDTGTVGDEVYLAMEFVEGTTLEGWCAAERRTWREVLDVYVAAGRGLAAAHVAGLIHRDFKPANVLMGADGRVRVADFGIARRSVQMPESAQGLAPGVLNSTVTETGGLVGTPAYMSLEQFMGLPTDVRTDIFSYCVALYEAVYGHRPFEGDTLVTLVKSISEGRIRPVPAGSNVPPWLRAALLRGLRALPEERYPSMTALLEELSRDRSRRWRKVAVVVGGLVVIGALAATAWEVAAQRAQLCAGGESAWAGVWDEGERREAAAAFTRTGLPYAESAFRRVDAAMVSYRHDWLEMHQHSCAATRLRGEQSEDVLDRRMSCLDERMASARAWSGLMVKADRDTVGHAVSMTEALPSVQDCAELRTLTATVPEPADPAVRARLHALRDEIAKVDALGRAGKALDANDAAERNVKAAESIGYSPVEAQAHYSLAQVETRLGHWRRVADALNRAAWAAEAGRDDDLLADAAIDQVWATGFRLEDASVGRFWADLARAAVRRKPDNVLREARLAHGLGGLLATEGHFEESMDSFARSVELAGRASGPDSLEVAGFATRAGQMRANFSQFEGAIPLLEKAIQTYTRVLGDQHPDLALPLGALAAARAMLGRVDEGLELAVRARTLVVAAYGPNHVALSDIGGREALVLACAGRIDEAVERARDATRVCSLAYGRDAAPCFQAEYQVGRLEAARGNLDEAMRIHRDSYERARKALGDHPMSSLALWGEARVLLARGEYAEALATLKRTESTTKAHHQPDSPHIGMALNTAGEAALGLEAHADAKSIFELGLGILEKGKVDPFEIGLARFGLARAIHGLHGDQTHVQQLLRRAREALSKVGPRGKRTIVSLDEWANRVQ